MALQQARTILDQLRSRLTTNQAVARVMITDIERYMADALSGTERARRQLSLARATPINGRWPQVVTRQREEVEADLELLNALLMDAERQLEPLYEKVNTNPSLSEVITADVARIAARASFRAEHGLRMLTEAGLGRD